MGNNITREQYRDLLSKYDMLTGQYEDLTDDAEKEALQKKIKEVESKIHRYEREYGDGGTINEKLDSIYKKYSEKDYWGFKDAYRGRPEFTDEVKKKKEREGFDWLVNKTKQMIESNDAKQLKERVRYDQKVTIEIYEALTGKNLKGMSNKSLAEYFDKKYGNKMAEGGYLSEDGYYLVYYKPTKRTLAYKSKPGYIRTKWSERLTVPVILGYELLDENKNIINTLSTSEAEKMLHEGKIFKRGDSGMAKVMADGGTTKKFDKDIEEFIESEKSETTPHKYRVKVLWGQEIVLKETMTGTPVKKLVVGNWKMAEEVAKILNNNVKKMSKKTSGKKMAEGGEISDARIFVESLKAYNDGNSVGKWMDLSDYSSGEEVMEAIDEFLKKISKKTKELHEEYAIHDFEGFPKSYYSESMGAEDFDKIYELFELSDKTDIPTDVIVDYVNEGHEIDSIQDNYQGTYKDEEDFAYQTVEELGIGSINNPEQYLYVTDTDRRILSQEESDNYVDGLRDNDAISEADMEGDEQELSDKIESLESEIDDMEGEMSGLEGDELHDKSNELENKRNELSEAQEELDKLADKAREEVRSKKYDEIYDALEDPYQYFVKDTGMYSAKDLVKANFVSIDYNKLGEDLMQDYTGIWGEDGSLYIFRNYATGGLLPSANGVSWIITGQHKI